MPRTGTPTSGVERVGKFVRLVSSSADKAGEGGEQWFAFTARDRVHAFEAVLGSSRAAPGPAGYPNVLIRRIRPDPMQISGKEPVVVYREHPVQIPGRWRDTPCEC